MSEKEIEHYCNNSITLDKEASLENIRNKTIKGDTFDVIKYLPNQFVDLLIVDPPYNISKNYNGNNFKKMSNGEYIKYTEEWISGILHTLKKMPLYMYVAIGSSRKRQVNTGI